MIIDIDKKAKEYISEKGGIINVDLFTAGSCCIELTEPVVNLGVPEKIIQFDEYDIDGIKVFVCKFIHMKDEKLSVSLKSFMGINSLSVSGIRML